MSRSALTIALSFTLIAWGWGPSRDASSTSPSRVDLGRGLAHAFSDDQKPVEWDDVACAFVETVALTDPLDAMMSKRTRTTRIPIARAAPTIASGIERRRANVTFRCDASSRGCIVQEFASGPTVTRTERTDTYAFSLQPPAGANRVRGELDDLRGRCVTRTPVADGGD